MAITDTNLSQAESRFNSLLKKGYHADMGYLEKHLDLRGDPEKLVPKTRSIIIGRLDYYPPSPSITKTLGNPELGYIARYALGRDYHKKVRKMLGKLATKIETEVGPFHYRPFADSAPVLEKPLAEKAGLGWQGKNTLIINRQAGSYFFLGVLYTDLPLLPDQPAKNHCGNCTACLTICPTQAITAPYQLDSRRCLAYLTIENKGAIPHEFRQPLGNRIFGCDDCQLICPWNKFAKLTQEQDFYPRHRLDQSTLVELFAWDENTYRQKTEGSAIRRAGYWGWLRNIAVALGNASPTPLVKNALLSRQNHPSELVREHVDWSLKNTVDILPPTQ